MKTLGLVVLVVGVAATCNAPRFMYGPHEADGNGVQDHVVIGRWASLGAEELSADPTGATLVTGCREGRSGRINEPLVVDGLGWFDVLGTEASGGAVRYTGRVVAGRMALFVSRTDSAVTYGPWELDYGRRATRASC